MFLKAEVMEGGKKGLKGMQVALLRGTGLQRVSRSATPVQRRNYGQRKERGKRCVEGRMQGGESQELTCPGLGNDWLALSAKLAIYR